MSAGRPTKLTPEIARQFGALVSAGLTDLEAAAALDLDEKTITNWNKKPEFFRAVKKARAVRLFKNLERIAAGTPGWQGQAWALERNYGDRFAPPKTRSEHSGAVGSFVIEVPPVDKEA